MQRALEANNTQAIHNNNNNMQVDRRKKQWKKRRNERRKKFKNFTVVPLCSFERKFVKYDTRDLHSIARDLNLLPLEKGKPINREAFQNKKEEHWGAIFDMKKIQKIASNKFKFRFFFLTDGVSVSLLYDVPVRTPTVVKPEFIKSLFDQDLVEKKENCRLHGIGGYFGEFTDQNQKIHPCANRSSITEKF